MRFAEELETLIRARYPLICVLSPEENRVQQLVAGIAERRQKAFYEWSATAGLVPGGGSIQLQRLRNAPTSDPAAALDQVIEQVEPAIFLFKDLHPWLGKNHPAMIRKLKEIALHLKHSFKTVILVSPVIEIPPELEKEMALLTLSLPGIAELSELLDRIVEEMKGLNRVRIDLGEGARERLVQAARGLTLGEAENVFARILVRHERLTGEEVPEVLSEKRRIVRKSGLLEFYEASETFAQVGGLERLKQWLAKRSAAFTADARAFGLAPPRGILLIGVQGCGKSLCAKAVANLWGMPLLRFDIGRVFGSYIGSSEENMRRAIQVAESIAPAILWIDEIDKAFGVSGGGAGDSGTSARVLGTFLTWLSEKSSLVFVVATANEIAHLPPELLRKGRLDEIFFVDLPGEAERAEIFGIHLSRRGRDPASFGLPELAQAAAGFSGAEIEEAVNSALYDAYSARQELAPPHILEAITQTAPLSKTMAEPISALREWAQGRARPAGGA